MKGTHVSQESFLSQLIEACQSAPKFIAPTNQKQGKIRLEDWKSKGWKIKYSVYQKESPGI
jgi:hypothetical protein